MAQFTVKARRGFTMIEMMLVVAILAIAAAVIVPQVTMASDLKVAAAARMVMADLMYAQNRAIATQRNHYIRFDSSATPQSYTMLTSVSPAAIVQHPVTRSNYVVTFGPSGTPGLETASIESVNFDNQDVLGFDPMGSPVSWNGSKAVSLTKGSFVVRSGQYTLTVSIEPYTGEISVK